MKKIFVILFFFLCAFSTQAQDIAGSWKGTMVQDSPRRAINFELAIKEKDGKFYGYCYRLFIVNDSLIYNTVKIEGRITDSVLIIEDEQSVSKNFEEKANKIKVVYFFKLNKKTDDSNTLSGEWTTNRYKKYMAITGTVQITREQDFTTTQLFKRLEEKKLQKEMLFEVKNNAGGIAAVTPSQSSPPITTADTIQTIAGKVSNETKQQNTKPSGSNNQPKQNLPSAPVVVKPTVLPAKDSTQIVASNQNKPQTKPVVIPPTQQPTVKTETKPVVQKPTVPVVTQPSVVTVTDKPQVAINKVNESTNTTVANKPVVFTPPPVISNPNITKRETEIIQTVTIAEDSVVLSLYDNGEIDGDTVSVFINNDLVVSKVGLSAKAFKKTIYFHPGETMQLTFFAENLGSIPPNTGLLVIYTSTERYQIFFSSNYSKSSSILLRRKE